MMIFDLVLILLVLATVGTLIAVVALLLLGQIKLVKKFSPFYGVGLLLYFGILIIVSTTFPQHKIALGDYWCFNDW